MFIVCGGGDLQAIFETHFFNNSNRIEETMHESLSHYGVYKFSAPYSNNNLLSCRQASE